LIFPSYLELIPELPKYPHCLENFEHSIQKGEVGRDKGQVTTKIRISQLRLSRLDRVKV